MGLQLRKKTPSLDHVLSKAADFHGHLCPGTVIGTRMALIGLREIDVTDPEGSQRKDFIIFVETDRCPIDAISIVTGARISRKNLKFLDWGKIAATFVNTKTGKAIRIICPESARDFVDKYATGMYSNDKDGKNAREIDAYKVMPERELFIIQKVKVDIPDTSNKEKYKVQCEQCGETVIDHKEVTKNGRVLCIPCSMDNCYYQVL